LLARIFLLSYYVRMSIKRSKHVSRGPRSRDVEARPFSLSATKPVEPPKSWSESVGGQPEDTFVAYSLKTSLTQGELIQHVKFGKGVVVKIEGKRAVVLFEDGEKKLGHAG
jgi:hypothetical protein